MSSAHFTGSHLVGTRAEGVRAKRITGKRGTAWAIGKHRLSPVVLAPMDFSGRRGGCGCDCKNDCSADDVRNRRKHRSLSICYDDANRKKVPVQRLIQAGERSVKKGAPRQPLAEGKTLV